MLDLPSTVWSIALISLQGSGSGLAIRLLLLLQASHIFAPINQNAPSQLPLK